VKHLVILLNTESRIELLSHFMLDTKSFVLKQKSSALVSKETLNHILSTLSHSISSDRTMAAVTLRCGGVEWLSIGALGQSGNDASSR
jgi:hypothetical protein